MILTLKTPLGKLIDKLLKGEVTALSEKRFYLYVENLTNGDKGKLRQVLKDIDDMVANWKDSYFISVYEERVAAFNRSKLQITPQELDDIYHEENYLLKSGKIALSVDYLYESIAKYGFINSSFVSCFRAVSHSLISSRLNFNLRPLLPERQQGISFAQVSL